MKIRSFFLSISIALITSLVMQTSFAELPLRGNDGQILLGYSEISQVQVSSDGQRVYSASRKGLFVWDADTGEVIDHFDLDSAAVEAMALSPDDSELFLLLRHGGDAFRFIDPHSGRTLRSFPGEGRSDLFNLYKADKRTEYINSDSRIVLISDRFLTLLDSHDGHTIAQIGYSGIAADVMDSDGDAVAYLAGHEQGLVKWDIDQDQLIEVVNPQFTQASECVIAPDGRLAAIGDSLGDVYLVNLETGAIEREIIRNHEDYGFVTALEFSPDGSYLAIGYSGSFEGYWKQASLYDMSEGRVVKRVNAFRDLDNNSHHRIRFFPDNSFLTADQEWMQRWTRNESESIAIYAGHSIDEDGALTLSNDGSRLFNASGLWPRVWDVQRGVVSKQLIFARPMSYTPITETGSFSHDGEGFLHRYAHNPGLIDFNTGEFAWEIDAREASYSPTENLIASLSENFLFDPGIYLWNGETGERIDSFGEDYPYTAERLIFSPDGTKLIAIHSRSESESALISIWDVASRSLELEIETMIHGMINSARLSSDHQLLALAASSGYYMFEMGDRQLLWSREFPNPNPHWREAGRSPLFFFPHDDRSAFLFQDDLTKIDPLTGETIQSFPAIHREYINTSATISSDQKWLAYSSGSSINVWNLESLQSSVPFWDRVK